VSTESRDLFIEMTGTDQWTIDRMLNIVCYALSARGGRVEDVEISYPDHDTVRPAFEVDTKAVTHERVETMLGVDLDTSEVVDCCERAGLDAEAREFGDDEVEYLVSVPPYRVDVLHPVDVVDDIGRALGFNDLEPRYPDVGTVGGRTERSRLSEAVRNTLVGLGHEDLLNFHMTNEPDTFDDVRLTPGTDGVYGAEEPVRITEPYSEDFTILRTWCLPSVLTVLENNTHRAYPQDLAEVGFVAHRDDAENTGVAERRTVAAVVARHDASYEDAKSRLQALCRAFDVDLETPPTDHPTFLDGRAATVRIDGADVGVIGEVHPGVLVTHDLEVPVAAFEFDLAALSD
jgi:phenylalanyl-tRNA synthetase beta chain